ncbi:PREDICTED: ribonuclease H2 subunit A [Dufourea novaeangliae]|uniref:Ribonuclease n=1 Tax=Dufourea novaeangliae TaxID=178035 RepID=A0A154PRQ5_DUFNO|nr:PREDICTED: ribonuclease H2 subunit A [Dufourea novaeangliae]KZC14589.1 Ribonuclease H2 subunit A [Dufourea novaeangliae]
MENEKNNTDGVKEMKSKENGENDATEDTRITCRGDLTPYFQAWDHSINKVYLSEIPQICKDEPCQLGIDEAGRGPVLGPMVYGISYAPLSEKQLLVDLGCADSKSLTEEKRDIIFDGICKHRDTMGWAVDVISPNIIANSMYRRSKTSLNEVSMVSAIELAQRVIEAGARITEIYVDTVGKPEKYQARLEQIFPGLKIVVAKKADSTYPIVSAASICAKVSRDHAIRAWQFCEGDIKAEYGSGYPNDPETKRWLSENVDPVFGFPRLVRFSWSTAEKILESQALPVEWEDLEDGISPGEQKISSFFVRSPARSCQPQRKRHAFFAERCLFNTSNL